mgnify:CR=1 FL=1
MAIDLRQALAIPKVADGDWSTQLDRLGCPPGFCREQWNLSHPDRVAHVAASYVRAGADVIRTNTFAANRFALERYNLADKVESLNRTGAAISRQAAGDNVWVFGSMGPSGRIVLAQEVSEQDLYRAYLSQARALAAGGVDAILCETMTELAEALAAVRAGKETGLPVVASMMFDTGPDYMLTMMGVTVDDAVEQLAKAGAEVLGCNCGIGTDACIKIVQCFRQRTDLPIWARPNAGLPEIHSGPQGLGTLIYKEDPEEFASKAARLLAAGAAFVGGCCGTTPSHIARLASIAKGARPAG